MTSMRMMIKFGFGLVRSSAGQTWAAARRVKKTGRNQWCMGVAPSGLLPLRKRGPLRRAGEVEAELVLSGEADEVPLIGETSPVAAVGSVLHDRWPRPLDPLSLLRTGRGIIFTSMSEVTRILSAIEQGDPHAAEQLLPLVYDELRKLAAQKLAQEKPGQTLQATALVHEAYLRLVDVDQAQHWNSRGHFFAAAA